jgi:hypothetical protein
MPIGWMMWRRLIYMVVGALLAWGWLHAGETRKSVGSLVLMLSETVAPGGGMGRNHGRRATDLTGRHRPYV